jgi:hypothetical protein
MIDHGPRGDGLVIPIRRQWPSADGANGAPGGAFHDSSPAEPNVGRPGTVGPRSHSSEPTGLQPPPRLTQPDLSSYHRCSARSGARFCTLAEHGSSTVY